MHKNIYIISPLTVEHESEPSNPEDDIDDVNENESSTKENGIKIQCH